MLRPVISTISDKGLWIDHQPWLSLRPQNIAGVKIRGEEDLIACWTSELFEYRKTVSHQFRIAPSAPIMTSLLAPGRDHDGKVAERMWRMRDDPDSLDQLGDYLILHMD